MTSVFTSTCNAVAVGWLKDYDGVRIYTAHRPYHSEQIYDSGYRAPANIYSAGDKLVVAPLQDALQRCQSDPAVVSSSCTVEKLSDAADLSCALPTPKRKCNSGK